MISYFGDSAVTYITTYVGPGLLCLIIKSDPRNAEGSRLLPGTPPNTIKPEHQISYNTNKPEHLRNTKKPEEVRNTRIPGGLLSGTLLFSRINPGTTSVGMHIISYCSKSKSKSNFAVVVVVVGQGGPAAPPANPHDMFLILNGFAP